MPAAKELTQAGASVGYTSFVFLVAAFIWLQRRGETPEHYGIASMILGFLSCVGVVGVVSPALEANSPAECGNGGGDESMLISSIAMGTLGLVVPMVAWFYHVRYGTDTDNWWMVAIAFMAVFLLISSALLTKYLTALPECMQSEPGIEDIETVKARIHISAAIGYSAVIAVPVLFWFMDSSTRSTNLSMITTGLLMILMIVTSVSTQISMGDHASPKLTISTTLSVTPLAVFLFLILLNRLYDCITSSVVLKGTMFSTMVFYLAAAGMYTDIAVNDLASATEE